MIREDKYYILNLEPYAENGAVYGYAGFYQRGEEFGEFYIEVQLRDVRPDTTCQWRDYDHFAGVAGKFDPYIRLLQNPVEVAQLDFDSLMSIQDLYKERLRG